MRTEYLTFDELDRHERRQVRRATLFTLLVCGLVSGPLLAFVRARLEVIALEMPAGAFDSLWMPVIPTLLATHLALLFLARTAVRHVARRSRRTHEECYARRRAATLRRLFDTRRTT